MIDLELPFQQSMSASARRERSESASASLLIDVAGLELAIRRVIHEMPACDLREALLEVADDVIAAEAKDCTDDERADWQDVMAEAVKRVPLAKALRLLGAVA